MVFLVQRSDAQKFSVAADIDAAYAAAFQTAAASGVEMLCLYVPPQPWKSRLRGRSGDTDLPIRKAEHGRNENERANVLSIRRQR